MKRITTLLFIAFWIFPALSRATNFTDTDQVYGWNTGTTTQFYQTWADHKTQLGSTFAAVLGANDNYVTDAEKTRLGDLEAADSVSFAGVQATGSGGLKAGTEGSVRGSITLYSNVNPYAFGIISAATPTSTWSLVAPAGPPAGANYLFNVDADGTGGFTSPATFEPALGNPGTTGYVLSSTDAGVRSWIAPATGGSMTWPTVAGIPYWTSGTAWGGAYNATTKIPTNYVTNLSGTNTGDQTTITGNAGSATVLATARTIGGVSFDGSANINLPGVNTSGNQNTSGTAAGLSGTPNITVGTIGAGAGGFAVAADGATTVKSLNQAKTSGSAGDFGLYEANSTDTHAAGRRGPASITGDGAYRGQYANARPTSANMVEAWDGSSSTGTGTAVDPYIHLVSWIDLDSYQTAISFGANVQTALGVAIGSAGAPVLFNGAGGTPTSLNLTNAVLNTGTSLPGTCTLGQLFIDTDADTNGQLYSCIATNTWKDVDDDGSAGSGTPDDTPDNGDTTNPPTANWAYDHAAATATHGVSGAIVGTSDSATLTNKTLDANGTGNVVKGYGYLTFTKPHSRGTATGAVGTTETTQLYGVPAFADDVEANNYVDYIAIVPPDWDTSVDPTATFKFRLGGADTADHDYIVSMIDIADSAVAAGTPGDAINLAYTADGSGADGDIETATGTLTGWGAAASASAYWLIRVTRDGDDGTNDASTVDSYPMSLTIRYGFTQ